MKKGILAALVLSLPWTGAAPAHALFKPHATALPGSVPSGINYQGRLEESGAPVTGSKSMTFRLYDAVSGGNLLWAGSAQTVSVALGLFNASVPVPLTALVGGGDRYLEVQVEGTVLAPRDLLNAVPYAMIAKSVEGTIDLSTAGLSIMPNSLSATSALFISSQTGQVDVGGPDFTIGVTTMVVTSGMVGIAMTPTAALEVGPSGANPYSAVFHGAGTNGPGVPMKAALSAAGGTASCFLAGTSIATPGGARPIEALRSGDEVLSYDVAAGRRTVAKVLEVFKRQSDHHYVLNGRLRVTGEHPFWSGGSWVKVKDLSPGMSLFDGGGPTALASKEYVPGDVEVYNIEVDVTHTYFAGGMLVHNKIPAGSRTAVGLYAAAGDVSNGAGRTWAVYAQTGTVTAGDSFAAYFGGKVGIGIEQPFDILDLQGDNPFMGIFSNTAGQSLGFYLQGAGGGSGQISLDDATGNVSITSGVDIDINATGNVLIKSGTNAIFICDTAGAVLPTGTLTIDASACGTSHDTGLRLP